MYASPEPKTTLRPRALQWLLDFPIFYKVLIASTSMVVLALVLGFWLGTTHHLEPSYGTLYWEAAALAAAVVLTAINYFIIRAALQPVSRLAEVVAALRAGDTRLRLKPPLFGDRQNTLLIQTVNRLLDELGAYRRQTEWLSARTTEQLEGERRTIARELHDDTAQNLAGLLVMLQMVSRAPNDDARRGTLDETRALARSTLEGVRRISVGLRPALLDSVGLPDTLRWYVEELMGSVLPPVTLDIDPALGRLSPVKELAIYRVAQEALSNLGRHAQASAACLTLRRDGEDVLLRVADDGVGFDEASVAAKSREHLGLFTIRERARLAGGTVSIHSRPGHGTIVEARIPAKETIPGEPT